MSSVNYVLIKTSKVDPKNIDNICKYEILTQPDKGMDQNPHALLMFSHPTKSLFSLFFCVSRSLARKCRISMVGILFQWQTQDPKMEVPGTIFWALFCGDVPLHILCDLFPLSPATIVRLSHWFTSEPRSADHSSLLKHTSKN